MHVLSFIEALIHGYRPICLTDGVGALCFLER